MTGNKWYQKHSDPGPLASSNPLFNSLGILKIDDIYRLNIAKFIFSCLSHLTPPIFWEWFSIYNDVATRSNTVINQDDYFDIGTEHVRALHYIHILKFDDLFKFSIAKFVYSTLCGFSPEVFSDWFTYIHDVTTMLQDRVLQSFVITIFTLCSEECT